MAKRPEETKRGGNASPFFNHKKRLLCAIRKKV